MFDYCKTIAVSAILGGLGLFMWAPNAVATTVFSGSVAGENQWGIIQFQHTGGNHLL